MALININLQPSSRELRWFGLSILAALGLLGGLVYLRGHSIGLAIGCWSAGIGSSGVYYGFPALQHMIYLGVMYALYPIGWCMSHAVIAVTYYGVVTPIGLLLRLSGRDPLKRRIDRGAQSYWIARPKISSTTRYFRQY